MKTPYVVRISLFLLAILLYGCPNEGPYQFYTEILPDGSCRRELIRSTDSAFVIEGDTSHNPFPMKLDSNWKISFYKRMAGDSTRFANMPVSKTYKTDSSEFSWFAIASREYQSVEEMAESFHLDNSDWYSLKPEIDFQKKFRWFYTYFEFSEVYPESNNFKIIPVSDYLTDIEVAALYGEDKELYRGKNGFEILNELKDLSDKADKWLEHNLYEEIYRTYLDNYSQFKEAPVDSQEFAMEKDTIYKYYIRTDSSDFSDIEEILNHHFHTNAYTADDEFDNLLETKFEELLLFDNMALNYKLSMPGKIIETNAPFILGDTLEWKVDNERFYFNNYAVKATSRRPNYWAFIITGLIIIAAFSGFFIKRNPDKQFT